MKRLIRSNSDTDFLAEKDYIDSLTKNISRIDAFLPNYKNNRRKTLINFSETSKLSKIRLKFQIGKRASVIRIKKINFCYFLYIFGTLTEPPRNCVKRQ